MSTIPLASLLSVVAIAQYPIQFAAVAVGLVVSLRYRRLSDKMWLVAAAFAALCALAGVQFVVTFLALLFPMFLMNDSIATSIAGYAAYCAPMAAPYAWICLIVGLTLVWRDLSGRLSGLRELLAELRQESSGASL
ncbi:MAG: hypothetical protein ACT4QC_12510 [Planctomycetaceae bacterium]